MSDYLTAFILGLTGAGHCIVMCGGLSIASGINQNFLSLISYHSGRIFSYTLAGLLFGLLSQSLSDAFTPISIGLKVISALLLILLACYIARWNTFLVKFEKVFAIFWRQLSPYANQAIVQRSWPYRFYAGMLWGWLPCGLVYSVLTFAGSQADPGHSALIMLSFGLATWPALFLSATLSRQISNVLNQTLSRNILGIILLLYGLFSLLQVFNWR